MMKKIILLVITVFISSLAIAQTPVATKKEPVNIYNPNANAQADINAAVAKAKKEKKHVFIQVGGNWCVWCIRFHDLVNATPALKDYLNKNYGSRTSYTRGMYFSSISLLFLSYTFIFPHLSSIL